MNPLYSTPHILEARKVSSGQLQYCTYAGLGQIKDTQKPDVQYTVVYWNMLHWKQTSSIASCFVFVNSYESFISKGSSRGGQAYKSANSWAHSPILNPQFFLSCAGRQIENPLIFMINLNIANPQISTKYWNRLCKRICYAQIWIIELVYVRIVGRKYVFAVLRKFYVRISPKRFWVRES